VMRVSIHAPAWGATRVSRSLGDQEPSFNPRARVGRDLSENTQMFSGGSFNPRARVGRDSAARRPRQTRRVSIHAPAWGATRTDCQVVTGASFQSTRPRGARPVIIVVHVQVVWFQSTRPRGARPWDRDCATSMRSFQSTRPRGARLRNLRGVRFRWRKFQSTRPRGARRV